MTVSLVDEAGVTRFTGQFLHGVGATLLWQGVWNVATPYNPGDVVIVLNTGQYFLAFCVAANTGIDPFTDSGGTAKLGPHWYVEF